MFDFTQLRLSSIDKSEYAQNFWQKIFDNIDVLDKSTRMSDHVNFIFGTDAKPFPDGADPKGIFKNINLKIEGEYFFNSGQLRIDYNTDTDYTVYDHLLGLPLEDKGFKWGEDEMRYIINVFDNP